MAKTNDVKLTVSFADNTDDTLTIAEVADDDLDAVKSNIHTVNSGWTENELNKAFVSANGASSVAITAAEIVETTTELIAEEVTPE